MNVRGNIVLICDDAYVMPTAVTIKSIIENADLKEGEYLHISICTFGISQNNIQILNSLSTSNINIRIITLDRSHFSERLKKIQQRSHVTPTSLIKFELPNLLKDEDLVVYLDSDIIVKGNICELFDIDLSNQYVAAVSELWRLINRQWKQQNNLTRERDFYFNSGVMVMNLRLMRENEISEKLWNIKIQLSQDSTSTTMDQDALNEGLEAKVVPLSIRWNLNTYFSEKVDIRKFNVYCGEKYESLEQLFESAIIIHYVGKEDKPWKYETARCRELWDEYYIKCGFDIGDLERTSIHYGIRWKMKIVKNIVESAGIKGLVRFIRNKL